MNKFILFLVLNASVFGHTSNDKDFSCTPNEVFKMDCNTCSCDPNGITAVCTQMRCIHLPIKSTTEVNLITTTEDSYVHNSNNVVNSNGNLVCTPNEIKMNVENNDICNRCKCAANGIGWFCTKIPCPSREIHKRTAKRSVLVRGCRTGDILSDGCNHCVCDSSGIPSCTHLPCINIRQRRSIGQDKKCTPGEHWKSDCNDCFCTETGIGACTLRGCLGPNESRSLRVPAVPPSTIPTFTMAEYNRADFKCAPHEYFKLECNSCKCSSDGKGARCTKKVCGNAQKS
ncbi:hypothetical protein ACKWTF_009480 [Chironomus riparius]